MSEKKITATIFFCSKSVGTLRKSFRVQEKREKRQKKPPDFEYPENRYSLDKILN